MKLLIADEDTATRDLVVQSLSNEKIQIVCAVDGVQAWQILSARDGPRLAILDWILLDMSGLEICRRLRHRPSPCYTYVILTGIRSAKADMIEAFQAGADDYLRKPFELDELLGRVQTGVRVLEKEQKLTSIIQGWRTMLDNLPFGVACLGRTGQLMRANKLFVEMLRYDVEDLLGKTLKQTILPDAVSFSRLMTKIRLEESFDRMEMEMTLGDTSARNFVFWGRPIPNTKEMVYQIIISLP
jgi:PAS domain S-box-containing protein